MNMNESLISDIMLERYRLGELNPEDRATVENALISDTSVRLLLDELETSDQELRLRYPVLKVRQISSKQFSAKNLRVPMLIAAAMLCVFLPAFIVLQNIPGISNRFATVQDDFLTERPKGEISAGSELFIYQKGVSEPLVSNQAVLQEGHTIQLAYLTPAGSDYYGIIFSVDGRSTVTMHYPYRRGQSSLLVSGRRTLLNRAFILDDAPDYEVFVFLVSAEPLNTETVLREAQIIAENSETAEMIMEKAREVFITCEVETIVIKKSTIN
jgi:hypothetical protein